MGVKVGDVKVGDKVVLREYPNGANGGLGWSNDDSHLVGQIAIVSQLYADGDIGFDEPESNRWAGGYFDLVTDTPITQVPAPTIAPNPTAPTKHSHYFKSVEGLKFIDVYRVLQLFNVTDPCIQHALKKLLVAGGRGAGKDINRDIQEAIDTLVRWQEMQTEGVNHAPAV